MSLLLRFFFVVITWNILLNFYLAGLLEALFTL